MFDQDGQQSKKQRERLNEQLSSLFDDDFEEDEIPKKSKRKSHKKRRDYDDYDDYDDDYDSYSDYDKSSKKHKKFSLFSKKNEDDDLDDVNDMSDLFDYDDDSDDYDDIPEVHSKKKAKQKPKPKPKKKAKEKFDEEDEDKPRKPVYYDIDGNELEDDEYPDIVYRNPKSTLTKVLIGVLVCFIAFVGWGWYNTDFDFEGNAYVVSEQLFEERAYVLKADRLLNTILAMDESFDEDTYYLPSDYTNMSAKLTREQENLQKATNTFSKTLSVPKDYTTYHQDLINFSISIQECIQNLIKNKDASDYEDYREEVIKEYLQDLNKIKKNRELIEANLFRNMAEG